MIRYLRYSGTWYPRDEIELDKMVAVFGEGKSVAAILPHSALYYNAPLISPFFNTLDPLIERVIIISPSHYYYIPKDIIVTSDFTLTVTPFGNVETFPFPILGAVNDKAIEKEHGIEMFLPFVAKKGLSVSYALLSSVSSLEAVEKIADELFDACDGKTAFIASSDFTHYGERFNYTPYRREAHRRVVEHDLLIASRLAFSDVERVFLGHRDTTICGIAPAMVISALMRKLNIKGTVKGHYTSYDFKKESEEEFVSYVDVIYEKD